MVKFILKRLVSTIPVLLITSIIIFSLMRLLPGDPILMTMGGAQGDVTAEQMEAARRAHGFDRPIYVQYVIWLKNAVNGDLGRSIHTRQPVIDVLGSRILPTIHIGLTAWLLALLIAVPLGAYTAQKQNSWSDWVGTLATLTGAAMPYFLIGGLLIYFVSLRLGWLPASGYVSITEDFWKSIASTILPSITLALGLTAVTTRQARSSFIDVMNHNYIRTARAKGLSETSVVLHHAFRNAMLPVVTIVGLQLGMLFGGTVITETVFAVPGVGRLLIDSILGRDYPVVQAVVLVHNRHGYFGEPVGRHLLWASRSAITQLRYRQLSNPTTSSTGDLLLQPPLHVKVAMALGVVLQNRLALAGAILVAIQVFAAFLAPLVAPYGFADMNYRAVLSGPNWLHLMGTDELGRDIFSRLLYGTYLSLSVGVGSVLLAIVIGVPLGVTAGYAGGIVDEVLMRFIDSLLALPALVLALTIAAVLGSGLINTMIAIAVVTMPTFARLVRGQVLSLKNNEYVLAAISVGLPSWLVVVRHILPNAISPVIVQASLSVGFAIITESSLSFIGLGLAPPAPSWGGMVQVGFQYLELAPWYVFAPATLIFLSVLSFNLLGEGLRDALDPTLRVSN